MPLPVNKAAQNWRATRKAGVKPGTRTIQADGTLGGGTARRPPTIPRPNGNPNATNPNGSVGSSGNTPPGGSSGGAGGGSNGNTGTGQPRVPPPPPPVDKPHDNPVPPPNTPPSPSSGRETAPVGPTPNVNARFDPNNVYWDEATQTMKFREVRPGMPGYLSPGSPMPDPGVPPPPPTNAPPANQPPVNPPPVFNDGRDIGVVSPPTSAPPPPGASNNDAMRAWLEQGNIPRRFNGDINAALAFMNQRPGSRLGQRYNGNPVGSP